VLDPPLHHMWGTFYLEAPWFVVPLGVPIPANGVLFVPATIPPYIPPPYDVFMQGLIGLGSGSLTNLYILEVR